MTAPYQESGGISAAGTTKAQLRRPMWPLVRRILLWGGAWCVLVLSVLLAVLVLILRRVPAAYPLATRPIPAPVNRSALGGGLTGFDSPYLGHTGSWDGRGGGMGGSSKLGDLVVEQGMGLKWTFMAVYWRAMEPDGPVDLARETPESWQRLDAFVEAAHDRGLNILMQAPVVGGNAGGPPSWAGRREKGKSAPKNMQALADFAGKLAARYRPGGVLAMRQGWGTNYGVRAWELDNEPASYLTSWAGQAADYAEFATKAAAKIRQADPLAVIAGPGLAGGKEGPAWLESALDADRMAGSPAFRAAGAKYSIGDVFDAISFHNYEGLDSAFSGEPRTIGQVFDDLQRVMEKWETRSLGFSYARKQEYWHTEGNFDFVGVLSAERRAAWRFQFFTRAFAAGIRKVVVMDASPPEQAAVKLYVQALPNPWPMLPVTNEAPVLRGRVQVFRHPDPAGEGGGQVWVLWSVAGTGDAAVEVPVLHAKVAVGLVSGRWETRHAAAGKIKLEMRGDPKMAAGVLVVDRPDLELPQ